MACIATLPVLGQQAGSHCLPAGDGQCVSLPNPPLALQPSVHALGVGQSEGAGRGMDIPQKGGWDGSVSIVDSDTASTRPAHVPLLIIGEIVSERCCALAIPTFTAMYVHTRHSPPSPQDDGAL